MKLDRYGNITEVVGFIVALTIVPTLLFALALGAIGSPLYWLVYAALTYGTGAGVWCWLATQEGKKR